MNAIGIDMSKDSFHAAFKGENVKKFANTKRGITNFIKYIQESYSIKKTVIGVEATGVYHLLFTVTLSQQSWRVVVINPLESHKMITQGLRTVKTDRLDAMKIRDMTLLGKGYLFTDTVGVTALKALVVERNALVQMRSATKQRIDVHTRKECAIGIDLHDSFSVVIDVLNGSIKEVEKNMQTYEKEKQELLRSIPGIGVTTAAVLVAFIGDIDRFSTPQKLVAYIGLDSRVYQSGTSVHGKGYISKCGNRYLRSTLFNAAFIARQYNPQLRAYHQKKLREGKHYFVSMCAVERKLVHLIYAVWKRGTPYEKRSH